MGTPLCKLLRRPGKGSGDLCTGKAHWRIARAIYQLICELEQKELPYQRFSEIYYQQIQDSRYYCLVYEYNGSVVAALNLRMEEQLHHTERIAEILEFSVAESCRGKGVGKEMFDRACQMARKRGCSQIEAATNQLREGAHRFYLREDMHNFHYKFSKRLYGENASENILGR